MFRIAIIAALTAALMGCDTQNDTLSLVTVTPANQIMAKGTTQQFTANGTFSNGMIINFTQVVVWSSSNEDIATVSNTAGLNGIVTSSLTTTGTTTLTAFDAANNITGTALLTVDDPESIQIVPTNPYMPVNGIHQFSAIALFSSGTVTQVITKSAEWTSLSTTVATVDNTPGGVNKGFVIAALPGTAEIQVTAPNSTITGSTLITVKDTLLSGLTVSPVSMSTTTQQFSAIGTFQDGSTPTPSLTTTWAWSSSNTEVATIDYYTGIATAVGSGAVTITATDVITGVIGNTTFTIIQ
jgi:hypothetical protein